MTTRGARRPGRARSVQAVRTPPPGMRAGPRGGWVPVVLAEDGRPFTFVTPGQPTPDELRRYTHAKRAQEEARYPAGAREQARLNEEARARAVRQALSQPRPWP